MRHLETEDMGRHAVTMTASPVLLFDSGVGGLSVLDHVRAVRPEAPIVYCADNAGFPYGTKSEAELNARVPVLLGRLVERYRPCVVVIACNTASTIALDTVRRVLDLPVVGTVPAIKPAAATSVTKVIGVLGTPATVRQTYVDQLVRDHASDCTVLRYGSAKLVELAEAKLRGESLSPQAFVEVLQGLLNQPGAQDMDTIVLACTHFPLVQNELINAGPRRFNWVDSGDGIARRVLHWTESMSWNFAGGRAVFTKNDESIETLRPALLHYGLTEIDIL
jgi:glutamate racemase